MLCHESLQNHYKTNFMLHHKFNYSMTELDDMLPFEREIYVGLLMQHLEKQKQKESQ